MVIQIQDPLKPVERQPASSLGFDHRKEILGKARGLLNSLGSLGQKIFSAEPVTLQGLNTYLFQMPVNDSGYID